MKNTCLFSLLAFNVLILTSSDPVKGMEDPSEQQDRQLSVVRNLQDTDETSVRKVSEPKDLYALFGLTSAATEDEIASAFRNLSRDYHADRNIDDESYKNTPEYRKYVELITFYSILMNPAKRAIYDQDGLIFGDEPEYSPLKPKSSSRTNLDRVD